ncbi:MAG: SulP family inorganic anion transporter, partial [Cellulomonadaceae bacterium]|nr:SulP family inorganic anion transporter [Cellulomonadaceae bacterium]
MDGPRTPHHGVASGERRGRSRWRRAFPFLENVPGYRRDSLRHDLVAGMTVAAVAIPAGMAYSELVGVSPVVGLYTLLLPVVAYALLGSSRQVAVGAEAVLALMVGDAIAGRADGDPERAASLAAIMALLVGGCFLVARLLRLGWIADYFSRPVLVGYIHGTAVVLIVGQLPKMLGVSIEGDSTVEELVAVIQAIPDASATTALLAAASLVALLIMKRTVPRLPGSLVVVVAGILLAVVASLESHGIALLGPVPSGLPTLGLPEGSMDDV